MSTKIERSLFIEAHRWLDKQFGNTYFSAKIWVDGKVVAIEPFQYGYDRHFETICQRKLVELGYIPKKFENASLWRIARDERFDYYSVAIDGLKKSMFVQTKDYKEVRA
jgi:capsid portal protein